MFQLHDAAVHLRRRLAVGPLTAELHGGSMVALMGANGSGKTTLLRLLAGLVKPTQGTIQRAATTAAFVAQHQNQDRFLPLTVAEVVTIARYGSRGLLGRMKSTDRQLVTTALERLGVADLRRQSFGELSGGQRQRVLVAMALAMDAPVLLLDEPITGLDLPSQQTILNVMAAERDAGRLVVLSTHHLGEARECDRVLLLRTSVVADGPPAQVLVPKNLEVAFGSQMVRTGATDIEIIDHHGHGTHDAEHTHG